MAGHQQGPGPGTGSSPGLPWSPSLLQGCVWGGFLALAQDLHLEGGPCPRPLAHRVYSVTGGWRPQGLWVPSSPASRDPRAGAQARAPPLGHRLQASRSPPTSLQPGLLHTDSDVYFLPVAGGSVEFLKIEILN